MLHDDTRPLSYEDTDLRRAKITSLRARPGLKTHAHKRLTIGAMQALYRAHPHRGDFAEIEDMCLWLLETAPRLKKPKKVMEQFSQRLCALGLKLDRCTLSVEVLHSEIAALSWIWRKGEKTVSSKFEYTGDDRTLYWRSPFFLAHELGEWLDLDLDILPDATFGIVPELKAAGYRHYICIPIVFSNGNRSNVTFASRDAKGFDAFDIDILRFLLPHLRALLEIRALNRRVDEVLRIYVGDGPHQAILNGSIHRGQMTKIEAVILFADMRDYTRISCMQAPEETVAMLNAYFDCLVAPIERHGGEILKYMGDGLLAIFRHHEDNPVHSALSAGKAAKEAFEALAKANAEQRFPHTVRAGIALHIGEAAYGNVGSGARLDFTVIGNDINLASRMAGLNKNLNEPLLVSETFVNAFVFHHAQMKAKYPERNIPDFSLTDLGAHELAGYPQKVKVYRLNKAETPALVTA